MSWFASGLVLMAQGEGASGQALSYLMPLAAIGILFYFMLIRPQRRQEQQRREMIDRLKKNDHVVTIGGIYGTVTNVRAKEDDVTLRVDDSSGAKIRVTRSSIARVITADTEGADSGGD